MTTLSNHPIHGMKDDQPTVLRNSTCPYCGATLTKETTTKEHVVGRRFVPKGLLHKHWNLILQACRACNQQKSELENDISAISMLLDQADSVEDDLPTIRGEVERKAKTKSQRTGKPVSNSSEQFEVKGTLGPGLTFSSTFTAPPQVDDSRIHALCRLQLAGFFYLLTFDPKTARGYFWTGGFMALQQARRADWGNAVHVAFMNTVLEWDYRLVVATADGFFRAAIRRHPTAACWSWALEWNRNFRMVGFFGDLDAAKSVAATFPKLHVSKIMGHGNSWMGIRKDIKLAEDADRMFVVKSTGTEAD